MGDELYDDVAILCHFDGDDEGTTFLDHGPVGHTLSATGSANTEQSDKEYGTASGEFAWGSSNWISAADDPSLELAADFAIEVSVKSDGTLVGGQFFLTKGSSSGFASYALRASGATGSVQFYASSNGSSYDIADAVNCGALTGGWDKFAVTRSGNTWRTYRNGVKVSQFTSSATPHNNAGALFIGGNGLNSGGGMRLDELRITNGEARHTGDTYTVATEAFPDTAPVPTEVGTGGAVGGGTALESFDAVARVGTGGATGGGTALSAFEAAADIQETVSAADQTNAVQNLDADIDESATAQDSSEGRFRVSLAFSAEYDLVIRVPTLFEIPWLSRVSAATELVYEILQPISRGVELVYDLSERSPVQSAVELPYSMRLQLGIEVPYSIRPLVKSAFSAPYHLQDRVARQVEFVYQLPEKDRLIGAFTGIWSLVQSSIVNITDQPTITHRGRQVRILEGDISASEGGYSWEGNFILADVRDYVQFNRDDPFTVNLYGEVWTFVVDGKELSRDAPAQVSCRIIGISPSAQYVSPRATKKDYEWDTPVEALAAATEVVPDIIWNTVDWTIPAFRLAFTDAEPLDIVKRLAEACGAVVESSLNGTLRVRPLFPVSPQNYQTTAPDHGFVELLDILSVSESYNYGDVRNRYRLMDAQAAVQDQLEWVPDHSGAFSGYLRAYPAPWRTNVILSHTADPVELSIGSQVVQFREEEELIEIYKGQGSTTYPVYELLSVEWEATNLGGLVFAQDSRDIAVVGPAANSLVRVRYRTRSLNYRALTSSGRPAQFLLESPVE